MSYGTQTLSEIYSAIGASFDADLWQLAFSRTVPIAIYVDSGDQSSDYAIEVGEWINRELESLGFEETQSLIGIPGSYLQLNLCRTPKSDDGPKTDERLRIFRQRLMEYLHGSLFKRAKQAAVDGHRVIKIAVAVGTIVILLTASPTVAVTIGSFVVSAKVWVMLSVAKDAGDIVETANKIFTSEDTTLKRPVTDKDPILFSDTSEQRIRQLEERYEKRFRAQEERQRILEAEVKRLRGSGTP